MFDVVGTVTIPIFFEDKRYETRFQITTANLTYSIIGTKTLTTFIPDWKRRLLTNPNVGIQKIEPDLTSQVLH